MISFIKKVLGLLSEKPKKKVVKKRSVKLKTSCKNPSAGDIIDKGTYVIVVRKGYEIRLDKTIFFDLREKNQYISATMVKGKPSAVQVHCLVSGKPKYIGSLKKLYGVKRFADGNILNFQKSNLIFTERNK